jgi:hypothetical protein
MLEPVSAAMIRFFRFARIMRNLLIGCMNILKCAGNTGSANKLFPLCIWSHTTIPFPYHNMAVSQGRVEEFSCGASSNRIHS